jgi:hypothetical protein
MLGTAHVLSTKKVPACVTFQHELLSISSCCFDLFFRSDIGTVVRYVAAKATIPKMRINGRSLIRPCNMEMFVTMGSALSVVFY